MRIPAPPESVSTRENRPNCQIEGCFNPAKFQYEYTDGTIKWRSRHGKIICNVHQRRTWHPVYKEKKSYCENINGFLGFKCTTTIFSDVMLEIDHIDGDPSNDSPNNLQTLCACCHRYKTYKNKDHTSDGRTILGLKY